MRGSLGLLFLGTLSSTAAGEDIRFPPSSGVVDLSRPPYNVRGDGRTDVTAAIQKAFDDHPARGAILYLPDGIYVLSDTIRWGGGKEDHLKQRLTVLQGQSRDRTILKLRDQCPGFDDPARPKPMAWTGGAPAQRFRNQIRNCTWDTGRGNPGAIGLQFNASNVGCLRDVLIRSGDGAGVIGLDQSYADDFGPCFVKNVEIRGFDVGVATAHGVNGVFYENVVLRGQRRAGWRNRGMPVTVRRLDSEGDVPALVNEAWHGLVTILDSRLVRRGPDPQAAALHNLEGGLYVRNLEVKGYGSAIRFDGQRGEKKASPVLVPAGTLREWASHALPGSAAAGLHLPVKETPEVPWDDPASWAVVTDFGARMDDDGDDGEALQKAVDSGRTTVCLPRGRLVLGRPVILRGRVRRLLGCETFLVLAEGLRGKGAALVVGESPEKVLVVERIASFFWDNRAGVPLLANPTPRTLVLREMGDVDDTTDRHRNGGGTVVTGPGEWFLEDVTGRFHLKPGASLWARYVNPETNQDHRHTKAEAQWHLKNEGGRLWVCGIKTEGPGPVAVTTAGGKTEILGGLMYSSGGARTQDQPAFVIEDAAAAVSITEANFSNNSYATLVQVKKGGATAFELRRGQAAAGGGGSMIPFWASTP